MKATCPMGDFEAQADTKEELMEKFREHAKEAHGLDEIPSDVKMQIEQSIKR